MILLSVTVKKKVSSIFYIFRICPPLILENVRFEEDGDELVEKGLEIGLDILQPRTNVVLSARKICYYRFWEDSDQEMENKPSSDGILKDNNCCALEECIIPKIFYIF